MKITININKKQQKYLLTCVGLEDSITALTKLVNCNKNLDKNLKKSLKNLINSNMERYNKRIIK